MSPERITLQAGRTVAHVVITAADTITTKTYTINIDRAAPAKPPNPPGGGSAAARAKKATKDAVEEAKAHPFIVYPAAAILLLCLIGCCYRQCCATKSRDSADYYDGYDVFHSHDIGENRDLFPGKIPDSWRR